MERTLDQTLDSAKPNRVMAVQDLVEEIKDGRSN